MVAKMSEVYEIKSYTVNPNRATFKNVTLNSDTYK
jgi:hypothetical protein